MDVVDFCSECLCARCTFSPVDNKNYHFIWIPERILRHILINLTVLYNIWHKGCGPYGFNIFCCIYFILFLR
jgi:hypothetical protein